MACNTTLAPSASTNSYDLDPSSKTLWLAFTSQTSKRRSITGAKDEADEYTLPLAAAEAWQAWYASTPDTPCIAICSTFQGDPECKGCGRSFEEVQLWTEMSPGEKRSVWRRITVIGTSWRFNRYAERAAEDRQLAREAADAQVPLGFQS